MDNEHDDLTGDRFRTVEGGVDAGGADPLSRSHDSPLEIDGIPGGGGIDSSHVMIGERIGRYEITGAVGAGVMSVVFKAHDAAIDRPLAIKVLSSQARGAPMDS